MNKMSDEIILNSNNIKDFLEKHLSIQVKVGGSQAFYEYERDSISVTVRLLFDQKVLLEDYDQISL